MPGISVMRTGIQARFLIALALFVVVFMALLGMALYVNQHNIMERRMLQDSHALTQLLYEKGNASAGFLARIAPQGILSYDYLLLEGYVEELSADSDIVYAVIFNAANQPVTHFLERGDPYFQTLGVAVKPENFSTVLRLVRKDPSLLIVRRPIDYQGSQLGMVEIGLSRARILQRTQELKANLQADLQRIAVITGILIFISLVALILLIEGTFRRLVVRPIQLLTAQMAQVQGGDLAVRAPVVREDEIGQLSQSFNRMAGDLQTQLNKIEEQRRAYKKTRDYLANILDNSTDMIATTGLDGRIVEFNTGAERTLGFSRNEVIGKPASMIYCDCTELDRLYSVVHSGQPVQNAETRLTRKDGAVIDVELTLSPLRDNTGKLIGAICIGRDVTQAKTLRSELIQAEKMASVGQVASWIAHQIRNYLGRILMNASAFQPHSSDIPAGKAHRDMLDAIHDMDGMVTDLLDYSRTLKLHFAPLKLNASLNGLLDSVEAETRGKISIERHFAENLLPVYADVFKLEQAFSNVLKNAVEAMTERGTLRVSTQYGTTPNCVTIVIEDTGSGIAEQDMQRILRPFFTTKQHGTGLGLAMTARLVEAHGGTINVTSRQGTGTAICIILPISRRRSRNE